MPWKSPTMSEQKQKFVSIALRRGSNMSATTRFVPIRALMISPLDRYQPSKCSMPSKLPELEYFDQDIIRYAAIR